jgi:hypothetical protein
MGTVNWTVTNYGAKFPTVSSSGVAQSGSFTSSGSAANITNLSPRAGEVVTLTALQGTWIRFGGVAATAGGGHYIAANTTRDFEVQQGDAGAVSAIEG